MNNILENDPEKCFEQLLGIYNRTHDNYKVVSVYMDHYPYEEKKYLQDKLHKLIKGFHDNAVTHG